MRAPRAWVLFLVGLCPVAWATPTVTLTLSSSRNAQTISPGTIVDWTIRVSVSAGDNAGLALVACDLVQGENNPAFFDIPPGDPASIDSVMDDFSRPLGISNPGENGATTGYIGVQRGTPGRKNLVQIGGAQNTFGAPGLPGIGEDYNVEGGVGQSGPQVVLAGSFPAPAAPGTYVFRLENAIANVLTTVNQPPAFSPVTSANVDLTAASFSFTVGGPFMRGDMNCDGVVNAFDIDPFVLALTNPSQYGSQYPNCNLNNGDIDCNGVLNAFDIDGFVNCLTQGGCPPCP
jgi:hypothetical protein